LSACRSVADLDAAEAPAVTIPEALANETAGRRRVVVIHRTAIGRAAGGYGSADDRAADQSGRYACGDATMVATATKAANVFFMSWALLEMAPSASAGV
jgi:hypothetical protein